MREADRPWVLGIGASHNGALCLLHGDRVAVAIQEERLVRFKRAEVYGGRPSLALSYCLESAGITADDLSHVVLCAAGSNRVTKHAVALHPQLRAAERGIPFTTISHHMGHAVGAFATSGFDEAAVLVVDGIGSPAADFSSAERGAIVGAAAEENETISLFHASGTSVTPLEKHLWQGSRKLRNAFIDGEVLTGGMPRFGSLGAMYSAVGSQIFGDHMNGPGKVMGLAPYGNPTIPPEDFFAIDGDQFVYLDTVPRRFRRAERWPNCQSEYVDLAASVQRALEEALLLVARRLRARTGCRNLCYAGGVALNSVANERILREAGFDRIYFMPAAEDSGTALGAAYAGLWCRTRTNSCRALGHDAVGRAYTNEEIADAVARTPAVQMVTPADLIADTVERLCAGQVVAWFQGRSELGPRALGQRSILCDPRRPDMKERLNKCVKHREGFRPFAPIVLLDRAAEWFDLDGVTPESPYMLRVAAFREDKRALVPAVVHVDGTGRLQTLTQADNGLLYELVQAFETRSGVPILLNTSFNVAGEPIVETPGDALWALLYTGIDCCVLGPHVVTKTPGYRSVLDLYVRLEAEWVSSIAPASDGKVAPASDVFDGPMALPVETPVPASDFESKVRARGYAYVKYETRTRWGPVAHLCEHNLMTVVKRFDGSTKGRAVLDALLEGGATVDERWLVRLIGRLRRAGLISVHEHPAGGAEAR